MKRVSKAQPGNSPRVPHVKRRALNNSSLQYVPHPVVPDPNWDDLLSNDDIEMLCIKAADSTSNPSKRLLSSGESQIFSIAVRIEGNLISVPVKKVDIDVLTIGWLVKQSVERYAYLFNRKVEMQITLDGAISVNSDPLAVALGSAEIGARVLSWKTVSIGDQYLKACKEFEEPPIDQIVYALESGNFKKDYQLHDQRMRPEDLQPVLSIVKQQRPITINLSNNFLNDNSVRILLNLDGTLDDLTHLDLSGNRITGASLYNFRYKLPKLDVLDLSNNLIGDLSLGNLNFRNLRTLSLRKCGIQNIAELPLQHVETLDVSYNNLAYSIMKLRRKVLDVKSLDLSFIKSVRWHNFFTGYWGALVELKLAGNELTDAVVFHVLQLCISLKVVDFAYNPELTHHALEAILNRNMLKIYLEGCPNILENLKNCDDQKMPELLRLTIITNVAERVEWLKKIWKRQHGDKARICVESTLVTASIIDDGYLDDFILPLPFE